MMTKMNGALAVFVSTSQVPSRRPHLSCFEIDLARPLLASGLSTSAPTGAAASRRKFHS
jgi:hypothetical protein